MAAINTRDGPRDSSAQRLCSEPCPLREGLRALAFELSAAEARERQRIARELHDDIGQLLSVARFRLGELRHAIDAAQVPALDEISALLAQVSQGTRSATFDLANPALALGLTEALRGLAQRLTHPGGPVFHVDDRMPAGDWPEPTLAVLYRVTRELALNALHHALARQVWLRVHGDAGDLVLSVVDDGTGIDPARLARGLRRDGGYGLPSAQAQMRALGGSLALESGEGRGTQATLRVPLSLMQQP